MNPAEKTSRRDFLFKAVPAMAAPILLAACGGGESTPETIATQPFTPKLGEPTTVVPGVGDNLSIRPGELKNGEVLTPEASLLRHINRSLKPEYNIQELPQSLDPVITSGVDLGDKRKVFPISGQNFLVRYYKNGTDRSVGESVLTEEKQHPDSNLTTVMGVFNRYFVMPQGNLAWTSEDIQNGRSYGLIIDNPDGSYDTRYGYAVRDSQGTYLIGVAAVHKTPSMSGFDKRFAN